MDSESSESSCETKIALLVLNYNGAGNTIRCVDSLVLDPAIPRDWIIVIDNGSTDHSVSEILSHHPSLRLIKNNENLGYAGGFNRVIAELMEEDFSAFMLMNNDVCLRTGALRGMVETLCSHSDVGIVGPAILDPGSTTVQSMGAYVDWRKGRSHGYHDGEDYHSVSHSIREVEYVSGCAMLVKREVFESIGLFDARFFLYAEEEDLCIRASKRGFRVLCDPRSIAEHGWGATSNRYLWLKALYLTRNRFLVGKRYSSVGVFMIFVFWMFFLELPYSIFKHDIVLARSIRVAKARLFGAVSGLLMAVDEPRVGK